jgi:hypothetical protein
MAKKAAIRIALERLQWLINFLEKEDDSEIHPPGCWCHQLCGEHKVWQTLLSVSPEEVICTLPKGHEGHHRGTAPKGIGCSWPQNPGPSAAVNYATIPAKE